MTRRRILPALLILLPAGCAVPPPTAPTIAAMPGPGRDWQRFQADDAQCRAVAYQQAGASPSAQAGTQAAVGSAAIGTALGAAAGALMGSATGQAGTGAALGAGTGLIAGGAVGISQANRSGGGLQQQYDMVYAQCMTSAGNVIAGQGYAGGPYAQPGYGYPPQQPYAYQPQPYGYPPQQPYAAYPPQAYPQPYPAPAPVAAYPAWGGYYAAPQPYGWAR